jgi:protease-4
MRSGAYNVQESVISEMGNRNATDSAKIAVINVTGEISYSVPGEAISSASTSDNIINQLNKAKNDDAITTVLMRWNSPGGYATAAEPICRAIKDVRTVKPVYSFIDSEGASLGYLLPNCTQYIYARPAAITGSIGVIIQAVDFYGVLEKLGGRVVFITNSAGTQKSGMDIFDSSSETYKTYQRLLDEQYSYFVDKVYEGRRLNHPEITREQLRRYADGRIFSGLQAKELKLVDETAEFSETLSLLVTKENLGNRRVDIVEYHTVTNPFSDLFGGLQASLKSANVRDQVSKSEMSILMKSGVVAPIPPSKEE